MRRRRPKTSHTLGTSTATVLLLTLSSPAAAQAEDAAADTDALNRFLAEVDTLAAEFTQELWAADQTLLEESQGTLALKRPDRFRLNYETPYEQLVLADGERLWTYDVELAQATVVELTQFDTTSPAMLLSGDARVVENFEVLERFELDGEQWVRMRPREPSTEYQEVSIVFQMGVPQALEFIDGLDQTTRIRLTNIEINPSLRDREFEFRRPRGVDVIGGEG